MRILVTVPWGRRLGGAETMLQGLIEGAGEHPHEFELVFFEPGPWPEELRQAGVRVQVIPSGRLRQAHKYLATVLRLARLLRARRPDVILNWSAKTQLYGAPAALLAGMPGRVLWWQHAFPRRDWLDGSATLLPAAAIGCTSHAAARAQARLLPARRTFVVAAGSPVPAADADPARLELPADVPIVGLVGRLQPWKGQDRLLRAQAILHERGNRIHTLIVGGDSYGLSPEYAASLEPLVDELGLRGDVTMTGETPDAGPYIARMDILVNASDREPFGIVILEGMARGAAVVAVNSGGPPEFIEDQVTGLLASSGEPPALADAIEPLLRSNALRERVAQAGRRRFMEEYTTAAMRRRFFARLQEIVDGRDTHAPEDDDGRDARR
jgi:glycosyltransferase involved in cell wall biosynthesis